MRMNGATEARLVVNGVAGGFHTFVVGKPIVNCSNGREKRTFEVDVRIDDDNIGTLISRALATGKCLGTITVEDPGRKLLKTSDKKQLTPKQLRMFANQRSGQ